MSDPFEDLLRRWLRDRGGTDRSALQALAGNVAALPPRRRRTTSPLGAAAAILVALGLAAFALAPRSGSVTASPSTSASAPVPPDPAAFAGDPRLGRCGATVETALDAFEMAHARDYRLHLPAMLLAPELDVDAPAFVVVYAAMQPFGVGGAAPPPGQTWPPRSLAPGHHDVCVLVGSDLDTAERNIYADVDTAGLTVDVVSASPSDPRPSGTSVAETPSGATTPEPDPAWAADATTSLECDTGLSTVGPTGPMDIGEDGSTAGAAVHALLGFTRNSLVIFPTEGFVSRTATNRAELFTYVVGGRVKAAIVTHTRDRAANLWWVSSAASCDPAEWDPGTPTGVPLRIWTDGAGDRVAASILLERADCYGATVMRLDGRLYVRDPGQAVDRSQLEATYDGDTALPSTARKQVYRDGDRRLYLARDGKAAYVARPGIVERWPHVRGDEIQRIDCN